jgi:hypothetical protein
MLTKEMEAEAAAKAQLDADVAHREEVKRIDRRRADELAAAEARRAAEEAAANAAMLATRREHRRAMEAAEARSVEAVATVSRIAEARRRKEAESTASVMAALVELYAKALADAEEQWVVEVAERNAMERRSAAAHALAIDELAAQHSVALAVADAERASQERAAAEAAREAEARSAALVSEHEATIQALSATHTQEAAASAAALAERDGAIGTLTATVAARDVTIETLRAQVGRQSEMLAQLRGNVEMLRAQLAVPPPPLVCVGRVRIHVSHASNLRAGDANQSSDPYVVVHLGGRSEKTSVVTSDLNPRYDWQCSFGFESVALAMAQTLKLEVWDCDHGQRLWSGLDDLLGSGSVNLRVHQSALEDGARVDCGAARA